MTKREKYLERIHILRTLANYGPLHASDLADRANSECDHDVFDDLPEISRRGIGQKLQAMEGEGLVAGSFLGVGLPKQWELVEGGRRALAIFEQEEGSLGDGEKTYTMDEWASAWRRRCELLEDMHKVTLGFLEKLLDWGYGADAPDLAKQEWAEARAWLAKVRPDA